MKSVLSDEERIAWLRLIRSEGVGPRTFRSLLRQFGSAEQALEALPDLARRGGRLLVRVATRSEAERELANAAKLGIRFVAFGELDYPKPLQAIDDAPPLIAVRGSVATLARPTVAIVGSRNASAAGLTFTERLARQLGENRYVIASGLARGIDTRAHRASLQTGTIAVIAGGHDRLYPAENGPLVEKILDSGGAIVSEMPLGWEPRGRDFPRRNRIVSGLSYGVVVVEAARRSGSLITARYALEQGREVFAVPGSPLDPRAEGPNDLIREGATLCAAADHVTAVLDSLIDTEPRFATRREGLNDDAHLPVQFGNEDETSEPIADPIIVPRKSSSVSPASGDGSDRSRLIELLGPSPIHIDELARQSGLPIRTVQMTLLELEIAGRLERHGGNAVSLLTKG